MMSENMKHFLFVSQGAWGHIRPMISFASQLVIRFPQVQITFLVGCEIGRHAKIEFDRYGFSTEQEGRLHILQYGESEELSSSEVEHEEFKFGLSQFFKSRAGAPSNLRKVYPQVLRPIEDSASHEQVPTFSTSLTAVVFDMAFVGPVLSVLQEIEAELGIPAERKPKRVISTPIHPAYHDSFHFDNIDPPLGRELAGRIEKGESAIDVFNDLIVTNDAKIHVPGCAPMFAYEMDGNVSIAGQLEVTVIPFRRSIPNVDGVVVHSPPCFVEESMRLWAKKPTSLYAVGPTIGPTGSSEPFGKKGSKELNVWLDQVVRDYGPQTLAYVCFGSLFFPPNEEQAVTLVKALVKRNKPAIIVAGSASDEIKAAIVKETEQHGKELVKLIPGAQQQAVLAHPATSFFLTHGGSSSVSEAISAGIPTVIWQNGIDQIFIANQMSAVHKAGIELMQTRAKHAFGKPTYSGVVVTGTQEAIEQELDEVFAAVDLGGSRREELMANIERLRNAFTADLKPGGRAHENLERFVNM